ncbi:hypothetical protein N5O88_05180 [Pseudomonas sp. GD03721]|jgi:hypothetical protein|nr:MULTISPECIES: hypothetical protein [Pseudomonas]WGL62213.1 hypothetical protein QDX81_14530 [Pseudomonas sp. CW003PS]MDH1444207.1 hypothetical protein [Pseudomonas sp. GD03722]MDM9653661.1 hypothetical protein [Pseudomonas wenzhouensis]MDV5860286.1 hypothetical protein [Pseudomonas mendocina]WGG02640.1 hypothetical protein N5O88_05180 [Pseudomonas sp. GD03721]
MDHYHLMLMLLIGGFLLLGVGFNFREHEWGVRVLGLGVLMMLVPIALRVHLALA